MCGIAGFFGQGSEQTLKNMTRTLRHRGPDDEGFYYKENVGLGHQRLSIIDLSPEGKQPMSNEDGTITIAFNGEIYNFKDLKKQLKKAHKFKGQTDTEVIVHLYEEIGTEVFKRLNGMFALAIYDKRCNKIIIARDRMGKKPLYWGLVNNNFIFASELKAIMQYPGFNQEINMPALSKYLLFEYVPTPNTILKGIKKLEPGTYLEFDGKNIKKEKYWQISFNKIFDNISEAEAITQLDSKLRDAVRTRLVSDVPLGVLLSGGIDSSAIAYYAQMASKQKIKTYSIGFKEASFDESKHARAVAKHLGTDHYETVLSAKDSLDFIPQIADLLDEPMADASIVPTYLLSKFTREHVTVALGGDGGDELFCGYDTFVAQRMADIYEKIPHLIQEIIEKIVNILPTSFSNISFDFKAKSFIKGIKEDRKYRHQKWLGSFDQAQQKELFTNDAYKMLTGHNIYENIDDQLFEYQAEPFYNQLIYFYLRFYLMDDILVKVDRASMFNSLEVRAPFLDVNVVNFVNSLPLDFKLNGFKTKYILKKLMQDKLPNEIINRKKKGFGMPIAEWFNNDLKPLLTDMLSPEKIKKEGLFNYQYIEKILKDHFSCRVDNRKLIWTLLIFQMWREKWLNNK